jgi:hypothetical protein
MNVIQTMDQHTYDYLKKIDSKLWSRHTFKTTCKSDMLLNNLAETFRQAMPLGQSHFPLFGSVACVSLDSSAIHFFASSTYVESCR